MTQVKDDPLPGGQDMMVAETGRRLAAVTRQNRAETNSWEGKMHVRDLMSRRVEWVNPVIPIREAARKMRDLGIGCLPVGEGGHLLGILTDRDIACRAVSDGRDADRTRVRDVMTKGVASCFEDQSLLDAAAIMRDRQVRRLPVLDRHGRVVGILSVHDLCDAVPCAVFTATMRAVAGSLAVPVAV